MDHPPRTIAELDTIVPVRTSIPRSSLFMPQGFILRGSVKISEERIVEDCPGEDGRYVREGGEELEA